MNIQIYNNIKEVNIYLSLVLIFERKEMQLNVTLFELNERNGMRETATSSINMKRVADFKMINSVKCENSKF